jgi:DNA-binding NtrC family response regulator
MRVGTTTPMSADVRLIAATNRNPEQAVADGKLREDLLYRLNVFPIHLPVLWDRRDDVELLADHFLSLLNKQEGTQKHFGEAARERMRAHRWPGNVRELRNVVQRAFIMAEDEIGEENLPLGAREETASSNVVLRIGVSVPEAERRLILATLENFGGDKKKTADVLKISIKKLYNRLREYNAAS